MKLHIQYIEANCKTLNKAFNLQYSISYTKINMHKNQQIEILVLPSTQNIEEITKDLNIKITKAY